MTYQIGTIVCREVRMLVQEIGRQTARRLMPMIIIELYSIGETSYMTENRRGIESFFSSPFPEYEVLIQKPCFKAMFISILLYIFAVGLM